MESIWNRPIRPDWKEILLAEMVKYGYTDPPSDEAWEFAKGLFESNAMPFTAVYTLVSAGYIKKPKEVLMKGNCEVCGEEIEVNLCCNHHDCGCMGLPTEPPVCSNKCYDLYILPKSKHTPGPWSFSEPMNFSDTLISYIHSPAQVIEGEGTTQQVAQTRGQGEKQTEECRANAALMAAAPEMYEILLEIEKWQAGIDTEFHEQAAALLKRLRGGD